MYSRLANFPHFVLHLLKLKFCTMKRIFILPFVFAAFTANAQITLNQADFGSPGDTVFQATDQTLPAIVLGNASAAAQNWDFSFFGIDRFDTLRFVNPATAPGGADFPNASVALLSGNSSLFFNNTASNLQVLGNGAGAGGFGFSAPFNPPFNLLSYPATYGANSIQNYNFDVTEYIGLDTIVDAPLVGQLTIQLDSIRIKRAAQVVINIDAFGNITLPIGTFNSLRALNVQTNNDTTYAYLLQPISIPLLQINLSAGWNVITNDIAAAIALVAPGIFIGNTTGITVEKSYDWFTNGKDYFICSVQLDAANNDAPLRARYLSDPVFLSNPSLDLIPGAYVYPNPSSEFVAFSGLPQDFSGQAIITDMNGRTVLRSSLLFGSQLSVQHLSAGMYSVSVISQDGKLVIQDKFQKIK